MYGTVLRRRLIWRESYSTHPHGAHVEYYTYRRRGSGMFPQSVQTSIFRLLPSNMSRPSTESNFPRCAASSSPPNPNIKIRDFGVRQATLSAIVEKIFLSAARGHFIIINADTPFWKFEISCSRDQASELLGIQIFSFPLRGPLPSMRTRKFEILRSREQGFELSGVFKLVYPDPPSKRSGKRASCGSEFQFFAQDSAVKQTEPTSSEVRARAETHKLPGPTAATLCRGRELLSGQERGVLMLKSSRATPQIRKFQLTEVQLRVKLQRI
ncbi:hypothetical protein R3P38DRAFT_2804346 [Favolaschia claudopus]|uniref:Uncharacterized protein n=1 Tax=Favolaschia claudopus TaxID=2862362 RepID=A0AAV9ZQW9_9AGAR